MTVGDEERDARPWVSRAPATGSVVDPGVTEHGSSDSPHGPRRRIAAVILLVTVGIVTVALLSSPSSNDAADGNDAVELGDRGASPTTPDDSLIDGTDGDTVTDGDVTDEPSTDGPAPQDDEPGDEGPRDDRDGATGRLSDPVEVVTSYLDSFDQLLQGRGELDDVARFADDAALDNAEAAQLEFTTSGWTQRGGVSIVEVEQLEQVDVAGEPATRIEACIDSSVVAIVDADDHDVRAAAPPGERRSRQWFDVRIDEDGAAVVAVSFPDDADC